MFTIHPFAHVEFGLIAELHQMLQRKEVKEDAAAQETRPRLFTLPLFLLHRWRQRQPALVFTPLDEESCTPVETSG